MLDPIAQLRSSFEDIKKSKESIQETFRTEGLYLESLGVKPNILCGLEESLYKEFPHITAIWLLGQVVEVGNTEDNFDLMVWFMTKQTWLDKANWVLSKFDGESTDGS